MLLSEHEAAQYLTISVPLLRTLSRTDPRLKYYRFGRRTVRYTEAHLEEYKSLCLSHGTGPIDDGVLSSIRSSPVQTVRTRDARLELQNSFQRATAAYKQKRMIQREQQKSKLAALRKARTNT